MRILDFIFPKSCLVCKREEGYICSNCITKVSKPKLVCPECKKASIDGFTHTSCQKKYGVNGLISLWNYEGVVRKAILALKYKYAIEIVTELQRYIVTELKNKEFFVNENYCLVPVPLHWYRENYRGFNQSEVLGKMITKEMNWKFIPDLIVRKRYTTPQVQLKVKEREQNIKGVFSLNPNYDLLILDATFVVFDDVYTTGSTLNEATKVLKKAGAKNVWELTLAK